MNAPPDNYDRLLRSIRALQQIQRTNPPQSSLVKTVTRVLPTLLEVLSALEAPPPKARKAPIPPASSVREPGAQALSSSLPLALTPDVP